jgi:hypothetical protein
MREDRPISSIMRTASSGINFSVLPTIRDIKEDEELNHKSQMIENSSDEKSMRDWSLIDPNNFSVLYSLG